MQTRFKPGWFSSLATLALLMLPLPRAVAVDDLKVIQLESDVRQLERRVLEQARRIDELERLLGRTASKRTPASGAPTAANTTWLDISRWQRVRPGMSELEVISLLGAPTSMRGDAVAQTRTLLYALEVGAGFLSGSVTLLDRKVSTVELPALK